MGRKIYWKRFITAKWLSKGIIVYKPLPDSVTVTTSKINGLGLFAKENIPQATNLGTSHVKVGDKIIRTPLGGFINHANYPNCVKV